MPWIKRNLFLVIGGAVALILMGLAVFFLLTKINEAEEVTQTLNSQTETLTSLVNRDPHPGTDKVDNIRAAKEALNKLEGFMAEVKQYFQPVPYPRQLDNRQFRALLDKTVSELQQDAQISGVRVPNNYWFTFSTHERSVNFDPKALEPLASQLAEVRMLCDILFNSKINSLDGLKRAAVAGESSASSQDYLSAKSVTNEWAVVTPYEVTFRGFSGELGSVLDGFLRVPHCFVVKNVAVEPAPAVQTADAMMPFGRPGFPGGMDPSLASRYGLRPQAAPVQPAVRPATRRGPSTILDEKMLRVTLSLETVKAKPTEKATR
jgi:hypothetical protein